jgi:hypothetical protein
MKFKTEFSKIITNKNVLYATAIISALNIIGYVIMGNTTALIYFVLLGLLVYNFSKNMVLVLGIPLILVNLFGSQLGKRFVEGFDDKSVSSNNLPNTNNLAKDNKPQTNKPPTNNSSTNNNPPNKNNKQNNKTTQGLPITPLETDSSSTPSDPITEESFEVGRAKQSGGYNIDYASTVEDAYNQLNQIIGSDGIKKLTNDTQSLMKQQLQLAEAMNSITPMVKSMAPLMQQAQSLLGNLGVGPENLGNISEIAQKFTSANK